MEVQSGSNFDAVIPLEAEWEQSCGGSKWLRADVDDPETKSSRETTQ